MISAAVMAVVALAALGITLGLVFAPETGIAAQTDGNTDSEVVDTTPSMKLPRTAVRTTRRD